MDTRQLNAVVAAAQHGSFTKAAQVLFISQSTLSRQVGALERQLGVDLFVRRARSVELTEEGLAFLPWANSVLDAVRGATEAARKPLTAERERLPRQGSDPRSAPTRERIHTLRAP